MIMDNKNYYDLLNVRPNASCREIHASYIRLLEEYKTDLNKTEEEDYFEDGGKNEYSRVGKSIRHFIRCGKKESIQ